MALGRRPQRDKMGVRDRTQAVCFAIVSLTAGAAVIGIGLSGAAQAIPVCESAPTGTGVVCKDVCNPPPGTICAEPPWGGGLVPRLDVVLVSPPVVEAPTVIALSSALPDVEVTACSQVGVTQNCDPYLLGRSGPDINGRYLSEWQLPVAPVGGVEIGVDDGSKHYSNGIVFTVIGNQSAYGDFRSCVYTRSNSPVAQVLVAYYAQVETSLTYQLQQKVRNKHHRLRWVTVKRFAPQTFPIAHSEFESGYGPFERRFVKEHILEKAIFPRKPNRGFYPPDKTAPQPRVVYLVKKGKKLLKRGVVSRQPCKQAPATGTTSSFITP